MLEITNKIKNTEILFSHVVNRNEKHKIRLKNKTNKNSTDIVWYSPRQALVHNGNGDNNHEIRLPGIVACMIDYTRPECKPLNSFCGFYTKFRKHTLEKKTRKHFYRINY